MVRLLFSALLCAIFLPVAIAAQDPRPDPEPPAEQEESQETPAEEVLEPLEEAGPEEEFEPELTPKQEEAKRKAAERAAKREARTAKRAAKKEREEAKRVEKQERQGAARNERALEQIGLGYDAIDAQKFKGAVAHFEKAKELEGGRSFGAELGLAHTEMALGNYAKAVQLAQRAVQATAEPAEKVEALTLAGNATLAARPLIEGDPARPQPGTEMFRDTALQFYARAVELAPEEAFEARAALDHHFPTIKPTPRAAKLLDYYLSNVEAAEQKHGGRVVAAYEALVSGQPPDRPIAVVGPVSPPKRVSGARPKYARDPQAPAPPRAIVGLVIEPDGSVSQAEVLNGTDADRDRVVVAAMKRWVFEPARLPNGTAVRAFWLHDVEVLPE